MRSFFRDRRFYVTQFPETPPANFPTAAKILYDLFCYLGSPYENKKLRYSLEQSLSDYVIHKPDGQTFLFTPTEIVFLLDRSYHRQRSLEYFLNEAGWGLLVEQGIKIPITDKQGRIKDVGKISGLILVKLFGMISGKRRIDIALYKKTYLGGIEKIAELDENEQYFPIIFQEIISRNKLIHIYDMYKWFFVHEKILFNESKLNTEIELSTLKNYLPQYTYDILFDPYINRGDMIKYNNEAINTPLISWKSIKSWKLSDFNSVAEFTRNNLEINNS